MSPRVIYMQDINRIMIKSCNLKHIDLCELWRLFELCFTFSVHCLMCEKFTNYVILQSTMQYWLNFDFFFTFDTHIRQIVSSACASHRRRNDDRLFLCMVVNTICICSTLICHSRFSKYQYNYWLSDGRRPSARHIII